MRSNFIHRDTRLTTSKNTYDNYGQVLQNSFTNTYSVGLGFFSIFIETLYRSFKHFHTILLDRTKCHGKGM